MQCFTEKLLAGRGPVAKYIRVVLWSVYNYMAVILWAEQWNVCVYGLAVNGNLVFVAPCPNFNLLNQHYKWAHKSFIAYSMYIDTVTFIGNWWLCIYPHLVTSYVHYVSYIQYFIIQHHRESLAYLNRDEYTMHRVTSFWGYIILKICKNKTFYGLFLRKSKWCKQSN